MKGAAGGDSLVIVWSLRHPLGQKWRWLWGLHLLLLSVSQLSREADQGWLRLWGNLSLAGIRGSIACGPGGMCVPTVQLTGTKDEEVRLN